MEQSFKLAMVEQEPKVKVQSFVEQVQQEVMEQGEVKAKQFIEVDEQSIFRRQRIQLFPNIYQLGRILCIFLGTLRGYILSNTQQHNNQSQIVRVALKQPILPLRIQYKMFRMGYTRIGFLP